MWLGQFEPAEARLDAARELAQAWNDRAGLAEGLVTLSVTFALPGPISNRRWNTWINWYRWDAN